MTTPRNAKSALISGNTRLRAKGLLNMMYTATELSDDLNITRRTLIDRWLPAGLPFTKDAKGHYWFNGRDVAQWAAAYQNEKAHVMPADSTWCLSCKDVVVIKDPKPHEGRRMLLIRGICPQCGRVIYRFNGSKKRDAW